MTAFNTSLGRYAKDTGNRWTGCGPETEPGDSKKIGYGRPTEKVDRASL